MSEDTEALVPAEEDRVAPRTAGQTALAAGAAMLAFGGLVLALPFLGLAFLIFLMGGIPMLMVLAGYLLLPFTILFTLTACAVGALAITGNLPEGEGALARSIRWLWEGETRTRAELARGKGAVKILPAPEGEAEALPAESHCVFCGDPFEGAEVVRCAGCDTPHHRDCWEQGGRCAMYGCGAREAVESG